MGSAKYFTSISLYSGYSQYGIADNNFLKTAFLTRYSLYEWEVIPMGLMNAPDTFIQTMNNSFSDMLVSSMAVFLYDILVYLHMVKEHFTLLEKLLVCLCWYMFYCKLNKCRFFHNSTILLSFDVTPKGMRISDFKLKSLNKWSIPTTIN